MSSSSSFAKNILNFSISTWVNFVVGFFSTFILTRIFMPEVLGVINLFYSTVSALLSVFCFGLDSSLIRFYYEPPKSETKALFIFKLLVPSILATVLIGAITFLFFGNNATKFFLGVKEGTLYVCILIGIIDQVFLRYLNIIYRMEVEAKNYNIQSIIINIVTKLSVILGAFIDKNSALIAIIINVICVTSVTIYYLKSQKRSWLPKAVDFDYSTYKEVFQFAFFGWISMFLLQGWVLSSQLIINNCLDLRAVGIYSSAGIFIAILAVVKTGFCTYWSAFMYQNYNDETKQGFILKMHDIVLFLCIMFAAVLFSLRSVLYLFIGEEFRASKEFFSLLLFFPLIQTIQETTCYGISIMKKNHILSIIMAVVLLINVGVGLIVVDSLGLIGVAAANFISAVVSYMVVTIYSQRLYVSIPNKLRSFTGFVVITVIILLPVYITNDIVLCISLSTCVFFAALIYKDIVGLVVQLIIKNIKK